jgi:hypothetical protein
MSATRYGVMMLRHARTDIPPKPRSIRLGRGGWMSNLHCFGRFTLVAARCKSIFGNAGTAAAVVDR